MGEQVMELSQKSRRGRKHLNLNPASNLNPNWRISTTEFSQSSMNCMRTSSSLRPTWGLQTSRAHERGRDRIEGFKRALRDILEAADRADREWH